MQVTLRRGREALYWAKSEQAALLNIQEIFVKIVYYLVQQMMLAM